MLEIGILTIFPDLFGTFLETAFVGSARRDGAARIDTHDLRDWATDRHRSVDDAPYGGGPGMVMTPEPLVPAIEALGGEKGPHRNVHVICLSPQGRPLDQARLTALAAGPPLLLVCGRYEGIDQRVLDLAVDENFLPRPTMSPTQLGPHLTEFLAREFAHTHGALDVTVARIGVISTGTAGGAEGRAVAGVAALLQEDDEAVQGRRSNGQFFNPPGERTRFTITHLDDTGRVHAPLPRGGPGAPPRAGARADPRRRRHPRATGRGGAGGQLHPARHRRARLQAQPRLPPADHPRRARVRRAGHRDGVGGDRGDRRHRRCGEPLRDAPRSEAGVRREHLGHVPRHPRGRRCGAPSS